MAPQVERVAENFVLGEGPHWDEDTQSLYFVDVVGNSINRYVPATKKVITATTGAPGPSIIIPVKGQKNTFVITKERALRIINWDGESDSFSVLRTIENEGEFNFNDAKCDPTGRLWIGTIDYKEGGVTDEGGALYAIEKDKITKVADKIAIANGLAFNTELKKFYYIDSYKKTVDEFDLDVERGTIANRRPIFTLQKHDIPGFPDGMAIDTDGNLWVAIFNGGRVIRIDPRKPETLLYTVPLPHQVTSVTFGGKNLDELYVTTGRIEFETTEKLSPPEHGALYRVTGLGVKGYPGERFVI